jgi:GTPase SAR1 family protein
MNGYLINMDPAVTGELPFGASIDIRDTVNYKQVMQQYGLGPNGGIVTSLNLFATRFDQVLQFVEKRAPELHHVVLDTPGQIEVFTWSASGSIITESLAAILPTCVIYVVDTPRAQSPATFVANMMYACSILYKTRLPLVLAFNKTDVVSHEFAREWMTDFEAFQTAARDASDAEDGTYMSSLTQSMGLVLEEFYRTLECVGVSAATGTGFDDLFAAIERTRATFETDYRAMLRQREADLLQRETKKRQAELSRFERDVRRDRGEAVALDARGGDGDHVDDDDDDIDDRAAPAPQQ